MVPNRPLRRYHFYPRSPYGERHARRALGFVDPDISIHALLTESDTLQNWRKPHEQNFYPRSPYGERLESRSNILITSKHFYPRSPYGERPKHTNLKSKISEFLSTLSLRRATLGGRAPQPPQGISIHALLTESDAKRFSALHHILISIHALLTESDRTQSASLSA